MAGNDDLVNIMTDMTGDFRSCQEYSGKTWVKILPQQQEDTEPGIHRSLRFKDPEGNTIELVSNVLNTQKITTAYL